MFYFILSAILLVICTYSILAYCFEIPTFKTSLRIMGMLKKSETNQNTFQFLYTFSKPLAKYIPLSLAKEIKYNRMLQNISSETAKEFVARLVLIFCFILIFAIPCGLISLWLSLVIFLVGVITVFICFEETKDKAMKQHRKAEAELPRFIETFTHSIKTNRNVIEIIDTYIQNYDSALSRELLRTTADMRTGNPEIALQRFDLRINNPLLSQLIRGILATMHGEDMTIYFQDLVNKIAEIRKKELTQYALKIKPKISKLSTIRAMWAIGVLLFIIGAGVIEYVKGTL